MISFDELMPDLEPELPLCPVPVIERRLREAAIEACEDAAVWRFDHPEIQIKKGRIEYPLITPKETDAHSILSVNRGGIMLNPLRDITVDRRGFVMLNNTPARDSEPLDSLAKSNRGLSLCITLKPNRTALVISDEMYRDHHKMIISGALAKAYAMAGQAWSDPEMAYKHRSIFEREIASARRARERGYVTGSHRLKPIEYAAPTRRGY